MQIAEENPDFITLKINPLASYSQLLVREKNPTAIQYINQLIEISQAIGDKNQEKMGAIFKGLHLLNQEKFHSAIKWCKNGIDTTFNIGLQHRIYACDCLYQAQKKLGHLNKALFYLELHSTYSDSLLNEENVQQATTMELKYQFDEQQLQDSLTNQQQLLLIENEKTALAKQNQNYLIASFFISLFAIIIFYFYQKVQNKNKLITQQKSDLEQLNTTKDRLFAIISHDLRKPALAFRGISKKVKFLIQQQEFDTLDKYGTSLEKAAYSLNGLLDNLLNWALQQRDVLPYNPAPINVAEVNQEIYELFHQMAAEKKISLKMSIPESTIIFADLNAYATIIRNLMDNAIKYTPEGGTIDLSAKKVAEKVAIKVTDSGTGIPPKKIKQLFDLQKDKSSQGTAGEIGSGLGLILVKDLVALNKGTIKVESEVAKGTTFEVLLPAA